MVVENNLMDFHEHHMFSLDVNDLLDAYYFAIDYARSNLSSNTVLMLFQILVDDYFRHPLSEYHHLLFANQYLLVFLYVYRLLQERRSL